ncbi:MAG: hypothetical protein JWO36_4328 [Myxococcales bacterium]|nr:hypothetical protein [Myxococcales bacterium]
MSSQGAAKVPGPYDIVTLPPCYHDCVRWVATICVLGVIAFSGSASGGPQVEIKAQSQLALSRVRLVGSGQVEVSGQLIDKLTGEGLANQRVRISVGNQEKWVVTGPQGVFDALLAGTDGPQQVSLLYRGDSQRIEAAPPFSVTTDPAKSQVQLRVTKVGDDPIGAKLRITAMADEGDTAKDVPVEIQLAIAPPGSDQLGAPRAIRAGTEVLVTRRDAGGPGIHRLRATFAGDELRQSATIDGTLELTSGTTTTMTVQAAQLAFEDNLVINGKVVDDDKRPLAHAAVTLTSGDRRLAQGATGDDGSYHFKVEAEIIGEGQYGVQVEADPGQSFVRASRSQPVVIRVAAPQPVPVSYTAFAFIATAIAAGAFFAARTKPWLRFRRPSPPAEQPGSEDVVEQLKGGLVVAKPSLVSTLRRANDDGFTGVVRDTVRGRPVAEAVVRLLLADTERELRTGADGSFAIEKLGAGDWQAEVAAAGHLTEKFVVSIPHRGELRGVRIDLVPVRERIFQLYRRAAEPVLPESRLWGIWSPRQIVDHVRSKRPSPALSELTDFVEEIYFSPRLAAETAIAQASERVDRAVRERSLVRTLPAG